MNKKLPQEYKETFFTKIIKKIKSLFIKDNKDETKFNKISNAENKKRNMLEDIKVDVKLSENKEIEKKKLMKDFNDNPALLENLSNERLEQILQCYLEENKRKRNILKGLDT